MTPQEKEKLVNEINAIAAEHENMDYSKILICITAAIRTDNLKEFSRICDRVRMNGFKM